MRQLSARQSGELACVMLPLDEGGLLVPNDCVAEVLPWRRVKPQAGVPEWCLGTVGWRGQIVVVVDFEVIARLREHPRLNRRALVVMNRTTARQDSTFYALASAGLPRLLHTSEEELQDSEPAPSGGAILTTLMLGAETVIIPDLRHLEDQVVHATQGAYSQPHP